MLLKEIQQRLFEGSEWSMLPVKDSSKGLLFQLAGIIVSHSIAQGGPSSSALCPAIYFYLADANPLYVLSQLRRQDIPLNAGTLVYLQFLFNSWSQEHWDVHNFEHFV